MILIEVPLKRAGIVSNGVDCGELMLSGLMRRRKLVLFGKTDLSLRLGVGAAMKLGGSAIFNLPKLTSKVRPRAVIESPGKLEVSKCSIRIIPFFVNVK